MKAISGNTDITSLDCLKGTDLSGSALIEQETPLEEAQDRVLAFRRYTTGTTQKSLSDNSELINAFNLLRQMNLSKELSLLANLVTYLQNKQAKHPQIGLPTTLVHPRWLAPQIASFPNIDELTPEAEANSCEQLHFVGDTPCLAGQPIWDRLEGERIDFYNLFKLYRDSKYLVLDSGDYIAQTRTMAGLGRLLDLKPALISVLANIYNWSLRCAYFDRFFEIQQARRHAAHVTLLQNDHLRLAQEITDKAQRAISTDIKHFKPKDLIALLELGLRYSRLSLGLPTDKPLSAEDSSKTTINLSSIVNSPDKMIQINQSGALDNGDASPVQREFEKNIQQHENILSILSVLQNSGALKTAVFAQQTTTKEADELIIAEPVAESPTKGQQNKKAISGLSGVPVGVNSISTPFVVTFNEGGESFAEPAGFAPTEE